MNQPGTSRWQQRLESFRKALDQLETACRKRGFSDLERAGLVQTFEFTFELAWKTVKDLLEYKGFEDRTPRDVIRRALDAGFLNEGDTELWLDALGKRNLLAHTYREEIAREAERLIVRSYQPLLRRVFDALEARKGE